MLKNKRIVAILITVLSVILLAVVLVFAFKSLDKGTKQVTVSNPSNIISSPSPMQTEESTAVLTPTQIISSSTPTTTENIDQAIDINKFSSLIKNSYNSSIKEKMTEDLKDTINEYANPGYRIISFSVGDVNNDNKDELVITYVYPYGESIKNEGYSLNQTKSNDEQENYLCVYGFNSGILNMFDRTAIPAGSIARITNLVDDEQKEVFVSDERSEYPVYSMYLVNDNKLNMVDLESIGLNPRAQFVSVNYDTIYMGSRISGGVYGGDTLKWVDGKFISIEEHYSDYRMLYKTQMRESYSGNISNLHKYDTKLPELKDNEVTVENPYQFLSLIGPNRTIYLKPGIYSLSYASTVQNPYVRTCREGSSGLEFTIINVDNLKIIGLGDECVEIAFLNESSSVLKVSGCSNVSFENIMMGHGLETYGCLAEVLSIEDSSGINIDNCSFYGCGAYGIISKRVDQMNVNSCVIEECSFGGVIIEECMNLNFNNISFRDNSGDILIQVDNSQNILFDGVQDNKNDYKIFEKNNNSTLEIKNVNKQ